MPCCLDGEYDACIHDNTTWVGCSISILIFLIAAAMTPIGIIGLLYSWNPNELYSFFFISGLIASLLIIVVFVYILIAWCYKKPPRRPITGVV
jgi:uncharacterized membrane protein